MEKFEDKIFIYDRPKKMELKNCIKQALYPVATGVFSVIRLFNKPQIVKKKYEVSICAIFKNEAKYFKEWLEFHKIIGIEHFYLYNNNSTDDYMAVLEPYIKSGIVTLVQWEKNQAQMEAYQDAFHRFKDETKWMGFIDLDEYVIPKKHDDIKELFRDYISYPSVMIYWRVFGTSGRMYPDPKKLLCEQFTVCWPKYDTVGKCFLNTAYKFDFSDPHNSTIHHTAFATVCGVHVPPVNCFKKYVLWGINKAKDNDFSIQINHYFTKSYQEYLEKVAKGDVYFKMNPHDEEYFYKHEKKCMSVDYSAYRYIIKMKRILGF